MGSMSSNKAVTVDREGLANEGLANKRNEDEGDEGCEREERELGLAITSMLEVPEGGNHYGDDDVYKLRGSERERERGSGSISRRKESTKKSFIDDDTR
jgi:hypothetical protein